jgi:hypothetical protein
MTDKFFRPLASSTPNEGFFNMLQSCDSFTSPLKEGILRIFHPEKSDSFGWV